jgi:CDP-2,3-bis-(O-geranylgeranyl)-sn-glycerol synthase
VAFAAARALWLFAPLLFAAALSAVVLRFDLLSALDRPLDGGRSFRGRRILGDGKTWRGALLAMAGCIAGLELQKLCAPWTLRLGMVDYDALPIWFGFAMGLGAAVGELPNSFIKRRLGIPAGKTARGWKRVVFYVWDQVDLLTGAWPALGPWLRPSLGVVAASFGVALALHPIVSLVGYLLGARKSPR